MKRCKECTVAPVESGNIDYCRFCLGFIRSIEDKIFSCVVEPKWGKPSFTMQRKVTDEHEALTLAVKYKQLSGGFNNYSNFRFEGKLIDTKGWVHLKTGELIRGTIDKNGKIIKK